MKRVNLKLISCIFSLFIILSVPPFAFAEEHGDEHGQHENHEEHKEPELNFSAAQLQEFDIKLAQAKSGVINKTLNLTGEVIVAPERLFHIVPRVSGVVRQVFKHLGDKVIAGDLLATLSSRELANAKAEFVAGESLLQLANTNLKRERDLYKGNITAKRNYLAAQQVQTEMSIKRKVAEQRLLAIGLTKKSILAVLQHADKDLTLYELRVPAEGVIIEKHAVQGEVLNTNTRSFTVADLSQVWVNLTVYQKDLSFIHQGQQVLISTHFGITDKTTVAKSDISWLSPTLNEKTRSATARVVIDNPNGYWRPGLFVNAKVAIAKKQADIVIPLTALQTVDGQTSVFVQHDDGDFELQAVQIGRKDFQQVEIIQGLKPGQTYVSKNAFSLKAQLQKGEFGEGHSH
ncbi:membrane fusion protein, cobalt-zinc-cadmium efflux system [Bathymodiolus platifrons methanotrophic gill symbiont]|uniref:efflux RND transporter periplasmic adaptor subunit n=1 Tax=Bathymodiolus platifrons methanotrophic gill symbiont TaxID=113268 RepID=UPI001B481F24|nr:efflux RND transporter periplasmic adaptor subunit [Bathymodiolus platifrons methanotrophic gill symbiont]GFO75238.1 membrane fusion protein, cobalt-zinc-cadmium efflux system [Bathymodiolus platifrons methanotrophic gill symbiont]